MLIRITNKKMGVIDYLVNGQVNKGKHRDEYDKRLVVSGDMAQTSAEINWANQNAQWSSNYKHLTMGFNKVEQEAILKLPPKEQQDLLQKITKDVLQYHFPHRDPNELMHHCEAHIPTQKFDEKGKERLLHLHLVIPLRDPRTDKRLECMPPEDELMSAIQSEICSKYKQLVDPVLAVLKNEKNNIKKEKLETKKTKVRDELAAHFNKLQPQTGAELYKAIKSFGKLRGEPILFGSAGEKGGRGIKIFVEGQKNAINIRGKEFDFTNDLFNEYRTEDKDPEAQKIELQRFKNEFFNNNEPPKNKLKNRLKHQKKLLTVDKKSRKELMDDANLRRETIERYRREFLDKNPNKEYDFYDKKVADKYVKRQLAKGKTLEDIGQRIEELSKGQRSFYVIYGSNIEKDYVNDGVFYRPRENPKHVVFTSKSLKCKVVDHGSLLTASFADKSIENKKKIARLMVQQGLTKGWDLETITPTGTAEWKAIVKTEIELIKAEIKAKNEANTLQNDLQKVTALHTNPHQPAYYKAGHKIENKIKNIANKNTNNKCNQIKANINQNDMHAVIKSLNLPPKDFNCFKMPNRKTGEEMYYFFDLETGTQKNAIDYLHKTRNVPIKDAIKALEQQLAAKPQQTHANPAKPSKPRFK